MPTGSVVSGAAGLRGFDCNTPLTDEMARAFYDHGYRFALRYVRRATTRPGDLTAGELEILVGAGLAVMPVQHVESDKSWDPSASKGDAYGDAAASHAQEVGLPAGVTLWCDLEGVSPAIPASVVDEYCRRWAHAVGVAGYEPGLYVGWHAGLNPTELYRLPFAKYWGAYNLNSDEAPAVVGVMMKQHAANIGDRPLGVSIPIDTDTISGDALGRFPTLFAPDGWPDSNA